MRILAAILASALFFPVSCTLGLFAGTQALAARDARQVARGDNVHECFRVAMQEERTKPLRVLTLEEAGKAPAAASFRLPATSGVLVADDSKFRYDVLADEKGEQRVVLREDLKDRTCWSEWRAGANGITPVSSRMMHPSYMFAAFPFAFGIALALYLIGGRLRRRHAAAHDSGPVAGR